MKCPICDNLKFRKVFNLYDDRYGEPNLYSIKECRECGHYCTFTRIRNDRLSNLYGTFYPRKNIDLKSIVKEAQKESYKFSGFFRWLKGTNNQGQFYAKKDDFFLDIGCGSGASLIEAENLGANAFGLEADPNVEKGKNFGRLLKKCGFQIIKKNSITPNIWSLMQIRKILKPIEIGEKNNQWITHDSSNKVNKTNKNIFNNLNIVLKTLIKILIFTPITILNRFIDLFGLGDSLIFFIKVKN